MKRSRIYLLSGISTIVCIVLVGIFVPLGTYSTTGSCVSDSSLNVVRLHLIKGETIGKIKTQNDAWNKAMRDNPTIGAELGWCSPIGA